MHEKQPMQLHLATHDKINIKTINSKNKKTYETFTRL